MPTFPEFYQAINRRDPFPWQARLAELVESTEQWPDEIGIPTGLGKTACLEIAVWWLASQADRAPTQRTAPTRIWWIVNRRLLVDSTANQARKIAQALIGRDSKSHGKGNHNAVSKVADRLRSLSADHYAPPLEIISLRGGIASDTPKDPSQPALILCTLPMYGSRLLFRGYGSKLRAVDAAMAGTDSLVLVDEAHLAPHLKSLVGSLNDCTPEAKPLLNGQRSTVTMVALTATGDPGNGWRFELDADDERHLVVRRRLDALKPLVVRVEKKGNAAGHLADEAVSLMGQASAPATFLVFANTPKTAREVFDRLQTATTNTERELDLLLLTGLTREPEAEKIRAQIVDPEGGMSATRSECLRKRHMVVVATQTLEVGADIDAEYLVTETCGVRALTQRLGRLNRFGTYSHSRAIYVHVPPPKRLTGKARDKAESWPVYGQEPAVVLERLEAAGSGKGKAVNLSPRRIAGVLGEPCDDPGRAPEVLPGILREWTKTTTPPDGEAPVEPYFSGIASPRYRVSLIWRAHVPEDGDRLWPRATDREAVDVPIQEVRDALDENEIVQRLAGDGVTVEDISGSSLRPGDRIVLPTERGLLDAFGWNASATNPVMDVSLTGRGLPLDATAIGRLCGVSLGDPVGKALGYGNDEIDEAERDEAISEILNSVRNVESPSNWNAEEWSAFVGSLTPQIVEARREVPRLSVRDPNHGIRVVEFDEMSLGAPATLDDHGDAVGARTRRVADCVGISDGLGESIAFAGKLHDIGKADSRFQRWLDPGGKASVPMAKSNAPRHRWETMRAEARWPRGGRHEDLSARLVSAWLESNPAWGNSLERDLLIHLVISHHGKGRPLVRPVPDGTRATVRVVVSGVAVEVPADLAVVDWNQPARFRRLNDQFGPWGLALLEAIVIRADHAVSAKSKLE